MTAPARDQWADWVLNIRDAHDPEKYAAALKGMRPIRDRILDKAKIAEGDIVLDVGTGDGLLAFGALERVGDQGRVIFSDISPYLLDFCRARAQQLGVSERSEFLLAPAEDLSTLADAAVDVVIFRSVLIYVAAKQKSFQEFHRVLQPKGRFSYFEPINSFGKPEPPHIFWSMDVTPVQALAHKVQEVYDRIQPPDSDPMLDFDERDLLAFIEMAGFSEIHMEYTAHIYPAPAGRKWEEFSAAVGNPRIPSLADAIHQALSPAEAERFIDHLRPLVESGQGKVRGAAVYGWGVK